MADLMDETANLVGMAERWADAERAYWAAYDRALGDGGDSDGITARERHALQAARAADVSRFRAKLVYNTQREVVLSLRAIMAAGG
jgi:hypothetical protein